MCGRIAQTRSVYDYAAAMGWAEKASSALPTEPIGHFNGSPGAAHWVIRENDEGMPTAEKLMWQYLSGWAEKKGMPPAINARLDKLLTPYYRGLMKTGRIIVPADGWYEWVGEKGNKQPWYIKAASGAPLFFAALTDVVPGKEAREKSGFVIVTNQAAGGMIDVHDRRPVTLTADDAFLWMDLATDYEQAEQIARTSELTEEYFEWHEVARDVNRAGHHSPDMIRPVAGNA